MLSRPGPLPSGAGRSFGLEGVIAKSHSSLYRPNDRGWMKVKNPWYWRRDAERDAMTRKRATGACWRLVRLLGHDVGVVTSTADFGSARVVAAIAFPTFLNLEPEDEVADSHRQAAPLT